MCLLEVVPFCKKIVPEVFYSLPEYLINRKVKISKNPSVIGQDSGVTNFKQSFHCPCFTQLFIGPLQTTSPYCSMLIHINNTLYLAAVQNHIYSQSNIQTASIVLSYHSIST